LLTAAFTLLNKRFPKCSSASRCHHLLKTFWGWRDKQLPDGTVIWVVRPREGPNVGAGAFSTVQLQLARIQHSHPMPSLSRSSLAW
jgi:hypothetical protein